MSTDDPAARGPGPARRGWRPRVRLHRPTGIRNGGLLLLLVAVAVLLALADRPAGPGQDRRLPGIFQHLPPPAGITRDPPAGAQPAPGGQEPAMRAHPRRQHPRPGPVAAASARAASASARTTSGLTASGGSGSGSGSGRVRSGSGGSGAGGSGSGGSGSANPPPVAPAPAGTGVSVQARVPSVRAQVTPPRVAGRQPPAVRVQTPEASADASVDLPVRVPPVTLLRR